MNPTSPKTYVLLHKKDGFAVRDPQTNDVYRTLFLKGGSIDFQDKQGNTLLRLARQTGLLAEGFDVFRNGTRIAEIYRGGICKVAGPVIRDADYAYRVAGDIRENAYRITQGNGNVLQVKRREVEGLGLIRDIRLKDLPDETLLLAAVVLMERWAFPQEGEFTFRIGPFRFSFPVDA